MLELIQDNTLLVKSNKSNQKGQIRNYLKVINTMQELFQRFKLQIYIYLQLIK